MEDSDLSITNIRDFLTELPKLAKCEYSETTSYLLWKTLNLRLKHSDNDINWRSLVSILNSEAWENEKYRDILNGRKWRTLEFENDHHSVGNMHIGTACTRLCFPSETIYYCFTCSTNPLYEICELCFDKEKHVNHSYVAKVVMRPEGRICHCGDPFAFNDPSDAFKCKNELNNIPISNGNSNVTDDENVISLLNYVLDFLIDVTVSYKEEAEAHSSERKASSLMHPNQNNITDDIMGKHECEPLVNDENFVFFDNNWSNTRKEAHMEWAIQIEEEECNVHYMDLASTITRILNTPVEYAISITKALEDSHDVVTVLQSENFFEIDQIAKEFQKENIVVHVRKADDIFKRKLTDDLTDWLYSLCFKAATSLQNKYALRISMLDVWYSHFSKMRVSPTNTNPDFSKINLLGGFLISNEDSDESWFKPWSLENIEDERISKILTNYNERLIRAHSPNTVSHFYNFYGSRFQYIIINSINILSKKSKFKMLKIMASLFSLRDESRKFLAAQYIDVYLSVLYDAVASDAKECQVTLMSILGQYTFQDPSIANMTISSGFIERTIRFAFTLMAFNPEDLMSYLPISLYNGFKLPTETIRNRRTIICFKDLCTIMSANTVPEELLSNEAIFNAIIESFSEFSNVLPLKRETKEHVEVENFDFSAFYFFFSSILIMTDGYTRSISLVKDAAFRKQIVLKLLDVAQTREFESLTNSRKAISPDNASTNENDSNKATLSTVREAICNYVAETINFQVGVNTQYFFNPMSYLFKFVIQWSQCGRYEPIPASLTNYINLFENFQDKQKALYISESALSTLVLIGQINVGFWVRNGTPITHQARMYTKYSMREFTYISDIFNVQFSMAMCNPDELMVTYLSRWGLKHWANGVPMYDYPDTETTVAVVNECILLLIQLLTEVRSLVMKSSKEGFERTFKSEIIHALCFDTCSYAQIVNCIPEHITKHPSFDIYLEKYANYTSPVSLTDNGVFVLKEKYKDEIDPYYIGLSSSRRYDVEKNIRLNMANLKKMKYEDTFVPAKKVKDLLKNTLFSGLYSISSVNTFGLFLKNTLDHIIKYDYDNLLPRVVHLIHLCVVNNLNEFMGILWHEYAIVDTEFCHYHSIGSILYYCLLKDNFSESHGKIREIFRYLMETAPHVNVNSYLREQTTSYTPGILWPTKEDKSHKDKEFERKKHLARLRKKKLMKKLAQQQMKFMENNSVDTSDISTPRTTSPSLSPTRIDAENSSNTINSCCDDDCVFCKMPKDDDVFVYFSYQERNICDHGIDFTNPTDVNRINSLFSGKQTKDSAIQENPQDDDGTRLKFTSCELVLRACGHGSHTKCLSGHMKSIRGIQNQTTKNIPLSYGSGLIYCPVCNSLSNSFLPKTNDIDKRTSSQFFMCIEKRSEAEENLDPMSSICIKAAMILGDLQGKKVTTVEDAYKVVNSVFINTISNTELRLRSHKKEGKIVNMERISSQCILTLHLVCELKSFIYKKFVNSKTFSSEISRKIWNWNEFLIKGNNVNLLLYMSQNFDNIDGGKTPQPPNLCIYEMFKRRFHQLLLLLARDMMRVNFYKDCRNKIKISSNGSEEPSTSFSYLFNTFKKYVDLFKPDDVRFDFTSLEKIKDFICSLLLESLSIFCRKTFLLFNIQYDDDGDDDNNNNRSNNFMDVKQREIELIFRYFKLPNLTHFLKDFFYNELTQNIERYNDGNDNLRIQQVIYDMVQNINTRAYPSPEHIQLIELPLNLSKFSLDNDEISNKCDKYEIAVCLLCGQKCHIQKSIALQGYLQGECTDHMRNGCEIISAYGVFLMTGTNAIYLSYGKRGTFYAAPYLSKYGETNEDYKFGTPVYLNRARYANLANEIVFGNMIPHIVFRLTDGNADLGGWETM
ncbi:BAQ_1a_G0035110.mRNA.1.CDS.1 [Saccharomyces cerevisiae]|nr:BAQ_1a_G0035110.mRNA.1.CDS.1 [Saccharomyces cerevisiae]CAI4632144.1 BAM_G0035050.mRNA.1.CDS.1 [Saccharomyces cerevisiae]CAI7220199.1 BAM_G0035050.mRNA.1.CDS.1 [Saccharomyces cerevisiae]CAI7221618.1 BAQ_1a_G0035110.mRNA.1.CDS.1 [Saccharomyces cerevisiae]